MQSYATGLKEDAIEAAKFLTDIEKAKGSSRGFREEVFNMILGLRQWAINRQNLGGKGKSETRVQGGNRKHTCECVSRRPSTDHIGTEKIAKVQ